MSLLLNALKNNDFKEVERQMILYNSKDKINMIYPLINSIYNKNINMVKFLIKKGCDINLVIQREHFVVIPLEEAIIHDYKIAKILIKNGAIIDDNILKYAIIMTNYKIVKLLIKNYAYLINNLYIHFLILQSGNCKMFKLFIPYFKNINIKYFNDTPLDNAIHSLNIKIIKILINLGAKLTNKTIDNDVIAKLLINHDYNIISEVKTNRRYFIISHLINRFKENHLIFIIMNNII